MSYQTDTLWKIDIGQIRVTVELQTWRTGLGQDSKHREMIEREAAVFIYMGGGPPARLSPAEITALRGSLKVVQDTADTHNRTMVRKEDV